MCNYLATGEYTCKMSDSPKKSIEHFISPPRQMSVVVSNNNTCGFDLNNNNIIVCPPGKCCNQYGKCGGTYTKQDNPLHTDTRQQFCTFLGKNQQNGPIYRGVLDGRLDDRGHLYNERQSLITDITSVVPSSHTCGQDSTGIINVCQAGKYCKGNGTCVDDVTRQIFNGVFDNNNKF